MIDDPSVSRQHAAITGGVRGTAPRELRDGDVVELGSVHLVFHRLPAQSTITVTR